ncbi:uncharacterized protein LOC129216401 [Uloborus diversus]|uniref:uncharacterized protein LOC129216401 n=1 Tax=Uloborus diversus TaxID=327109 RepID=UPI0024099B11|nr:uncharacterized protein LOC129216401 [Uloborus diversus]
MSTKSETMTSISEEETKKSNNFKLTNVNTLVAETLQIETPTSEEEKPSKLVSILSEIKQMKIELLIFIYMFSYAIRMVSQATIIMDKVCVVHFNHSKSFCENISFYPEYKSEVVKSFNNYTLGQNFLVYLPSAILVIFVGSWSDKYSRKVPLIVAFAGMIIDDALMTIFAVFLYTRAELLYTAAFFSGFSGSNIVVMAVAYSYVSDVSSVSNRTMKYTLFNAAYGISMPLGVIVSGYIFMFYGYVTIFSIATVGHVLSLVWLIFMIKETKGLENKESWIQMMRNFVSTENITGSYRAAMKRRPNRGRLQIFLLAYCMSLAILHQASLSAIGYSYAHQRYNWDNTTFSTAFGILATIGTFSSLFIVPLFKKLNLGDAVLGFAGSVCIILRGLFAGLASTEYLFYAANLIGSLAILVPLAGRSRISKIVSKDEIGKIFSFLSMVDSLLPFIATAAVSQIFNATLDFFPGMIFILLSVLSVGQVLVFWWITRLPNAGIDENEDMPEKNESTEINSKEAKDVEK